MIDIVCCNLDGYMPLCHYAVGCTAMMQRSRDCHHACFWPCARALSQPFYSGPPLRPPDALGHMLGVIVCTATQLAALQIYLVLL